MPQDPDLEAARVAEELREILAEVDEYLIELRDHRRAEQQEGLAPGDDQTL